MLRRVLIVILSAVLAFSASAQTFEAFASCGLFGKLSVGRFDYGTGNLTFKGNKTLCMPSVNVGARYYLDKNYSLGLSLTYMDYEVVADYGNYDRKRKDIYFAGKSFSVILTGKYDWYHSRYLTMYSGAGLGVAFVSKGKLADYVEAYGNMRYVGSKRLAWQAVLWGVEWRLIEAFGIYAEGGYGTSGCLTVGVRKVF